MKRDPQAQQTKNDQLISLPRDPRQLGEFIASLLGQRRRLSRDFDVNFMVDWPWVQNLDQLVVQRVEHQNEGHLVDFSFKLFLSNGRITHVTRRADFETFRDMSGCESVGIEIVWTFIVKFPTSSIPEKQEVRFVARTEKLEDKKHGVIDKFSFFQTLGSREEKMLLELFYSNITWGEDILQLISNNVSASFPVTNLLMKKIVGTLKSINQFLYPIAFMIGMIWQMALLKPSNETVAKESFRKVVGESTNIELIDRKIDILLNYFLNKSSLELFLPWIITMLGLALLLISISVLGYALIPRSFVLFNDFTAKRYSEYSRKRQLFIGGVIVAFVIGTLSSIFAARISAMFG